MKEELKTSYEWAIDPRYVDLTILDPEGWKRGDDDYEYSFFKEKITREEFELRVVNSVLERSHPVV